MTTNILNALTVPANVVIVYAAAPMGKVATMLNVSEVVSMVNRALNAWYYG